MTEQERRSTSVASKKVGDGHPVPDSDHEVQRMLRRLKWVREEQERMREIVDTEIDQLKAWLQEVLDPLLDEEHRIGALVEIWHRRQIAAGGPAKVVFPSGTLVLKPAGSGRGVVTDGEALLAWAEENMPNVIDRPPAPAPKVNLTRLKSACSKPKVEPNSTVDLIAPTGEAVPGVVIEVPERNWEITHGR